nr:hypothetical protein [Frankia sp. Mgl5]
MADDEPVQAGGGDQRRANQAVHHLLDAGLHVDDVPAAWNTELSPRLVREVRHHGRSPADPISAAPEEPRNQQGRIAEDRRTAYARTYRSLPGQGTTHSGQLGPWMDPVRVVENTRAPDDSSWAGERDDATGHEEGAAGPGRHPASRPSGDPAHQPWSQPVADVSLTRGATPKSGYRAGHAVDDTVRVAVLIRTYYRDLAWLSYSLAAVEKWCRGFTEVVVVSPRTGAPAVRRALPGSVRLEICPDYRDDYLGQQVTKLHADRFTDAELICHVDSDVIFTRSTTPVDLLVAGRPWLVRLPVDKLGRHRPWVASTEDFLGFRVSHDFMQQPPFTYPRWIYPEIRRLSVARHGRSLDEYVTGQPPRGFSEFNVLGAYALAHHPDAFTWFECGDPAVPSLCAWYWSRARIDPATRRELEGHPRALPT